MNSNNKRLTKHKLLYQLVLSLLLALLIVNQFFSSTIKFDEFALGAETTTYHAVDKSFRPIHITVIDQDQQSSFLHAYKSRGEKQVTFLLGNSQTHSINQAKPGDVNFVQILNDRIQNDSAEILCNSLPNGSLKEFYLSYSYWKNKIKIKRLVVPIFFDDLREDKIRSQYYPALVSEHFLVKDLGIGITGQMNAALKTCWKENQRIAPDSSATSPGRPAPTLQESTEVRLEAFLEENIQAWRNRPNIRGSFLIKLYQLRNTVFRINSATIRQVIPTRYKENMEALALLLSDCTKDNVTLLLYIPPIRMDVPLPYNQDDYNKFKTQVKKLSQSNSGAVVFCDLDSIIPGPLWGMKRSTNFLEQNEADYMHFKFRGHQILADTLLKHLVNL